MSFWHLFESVVEKGSILILTDEKVTFFDIFNAECFRVCSKGPCIEDVSYDQKMLKKSLEELIFIEVLIKFFEVF